MYSEKTKINTALLPRIQPGHSAVSVLKSPTLPGLKAEGMTCNYVYIAHFI